MKDIRWFKERKLQNEIWVAYRPGLLISKIFGSTARKKIIITREIHTARLGDRDGVDPLYSKLFPL